MSTISPTTSSILNHSVAKHFSSINTNDYARTQPDAATCDRRRCLRVGPASSFFFFSFPDSRRLGPYRSVSGETAYSGRNSAKKRLRNAPSHVSFSPIHSRLTSQLSSSYSRLSVRLQLHSTV